MNAGNTLGSSLKRQKDLYFKKKRGSLYKTGYLVPIYDIWGDLYQPPNSKFPLPRSMEVNLDPVAPGDGELGNIEYRYTNQTLRNQTMVQIKSNQWQKITSTSKKGSKSISIFG